MADAEGGVNVRVAVRARPLNTRERELNCEECVRMEGPVTYIKDEHGKEKDFGFDFSYWYDTPQQRVYEDLAKPIVMAATDGFNGVVFAYGQTGSGKTHSMMGSGDDVGIVPLMNRELFGLLDSKKEKDDGEYLVTASYMEIYNEVIRDLLNPSAKQLKIREHPKLGIYVEHLAELVVESADGIAKLLEQGNNVKQVAATAMNSRSSRSHCCFVVNIKQRKVEEIEVGSDKMTRETTLSAKINLVDLAGSERAAKTGAEGSRLKEGAAINLSLSTLGQVINMLAEGATGHIPYRNSKLTRVLQQALGGNARTVMIATISPADNNYQETLSTLQYASRAKKIKNTTHKNEDVNQRMIRELREEVERLRAQMAAIQSGGMIDGAPTSPVAADDERVKEMRDKISMLEETKKRQWDEVQKLSAAYEEERNRTLQSENVVRSIMQNVKEEKKALLTQLHHLEEERQLLTKALKQVKTEYSTTKSSLEADMVAYQELTAQDEAERDEAAVDALFAKIEADRDALVQQREQIKSLKEQIKINSQQQIEQKAEIEAQKLVLEEDADLRKAIKEEELNKIREEFAGRREELISRELESERSKLHLRAMGEMKTIERRYNNTISAAHAHAQEQDNRAVSLEIRKVDLECENRLLRAEVARLRDKLSHVESVHEERLQTTVQALVEAFQADQARLVQALERASADCVMLFKRQQQQQQLELQR